MGTEGILTPKQPELTKDQLGKLRRQHITQGPFDTVNACGHQFHATAEPKHANCPDCWEAFFNVHTGVVAASQSIVTAFGFDQLVKCRGVKFCKYYTIFVNKKNQEMKKRTRKRRWYHGTSVEKAANILLTGFRIGTWFARRPEDARKFGGPWVFTVLIHWNWKTGKPKSWQVCSACAIPVGSIIELKSHKRKYGKEKG